MLFLFNKRFIKHCITVWPGPKKYKPLNFSCSPHKLGLYEKPEASISQYGFCTQLVNSKYCQHSKSNQIFLKFDDEDHF